MNHLMIDIESLDIRPSTVIISVGAVGFNEHGPYAEHYWNLTWQTQIDMGRTVREDTIRWWFDQPDEARRALKLNPCDISLMLVGLRRVYNDGGYERVWANGITFDIAALEHAFSQWSMEYPWKYNAPRDMRLLRDLVPDYFEADFKLHTPKVDEHNALADAVWQAKYVVAALAAIKGGTK